MHDTVVAPKVPVAPNPAKPSPVPAGSSDGTMPINAAPARPLVSSDLDTHRPVAQSALADVDARTLASQSVLPAAPVAQAPHASAVNAAAASPIRMQRSSPSATSVSGISSPSPATEPSKLAPKVTDAPNNNQPAARPQLCPPQPRRKRFPAGRRRMLLGSSRALPCVLCIALPTTRRPLQTAISPSRPLQRNPKHSPQSRAMCSYSDEATDEATAA
ncbi:hypothetical protein QF001_000811 [Paraburkholderia youngii]